MKTLEARATTPATVLTPTPTGARQNFVPLKNEAGVAEIVNRLKGRSSRVLRQEFPSLRTRLPTLWSRSYFAAIFGAVSEATIRRYIEAQKGI